MTSRDYLELVKEFVKNPDRYEVFREEKFIGSQYFLEFFGAERVKTSEVLDCLSVEEVVEALKLNRFIFGHVSDVFVCAVALDAVCKCEKNQEDKTRGIVSAVSNLTAVVLCSEVESREVWKKFLDNLPDRLRAALPVFVSFITESFEVLVEAAGIKGKRYFSGLIDAMPEDFSKNASRADGSTLLALSASRETMQGHPEIMLSAFRRILSVTDYVYSGRTGVRNTKIYSTFESFIETASRIRFSQFEPTVQKKLSEMFESFVEELSKRLKGKASISKIRLIFLARLVLGTDFPVSQRGMRFLELLFKIDKTDRNRGTTRCYLSFSEQIRVSTDKFKILSARQILSLLDVSFANYAGSQRVLFVLDVEDIVKKVDQNFSKIVCSKRYGSKIKERMKKYLYLLRQENILTRAIKVTKTEGGITRDIRDVFEDIAKSNKLSRFEKSALICFFADLYTTLLGVEITPYELENKYGVDRILARFLGETAVETPHEIAWKRFIAQLGCENRDV